MQAASICTTSRASHAVCVMAPVEKQSCPTGAGPLRLVSSQSAEEHQLQRDRDDLAATQDMQVGVQALSDALQEVLHSLQGGRKSFWNEAAQKLVILLSAPGASQGEHFLQVPALLRS